MTLDCSSQTHFPCLVDGQVFGDQALDSTPDFVDRLGEVKPCVASLVPAMANTPLISPAQKIRRLKTHGLSVTSTEYPLNGFNGSRMLWSNTKTLEQGKVTDVPISPFVAVA